MSLRVLIADDEPVALDRLRLSLAAFDDVLIVGAASNGDEAATMAADIEADLILLDIQMPGRSGLEVARGLGEGAPEVIFVTAFSDFASDAFDLDAVDYLLKPVRQDRLAEALRRAGRRRTSAAQKSRAVETVPNTPDSGFAAEFWVKRHDGYVRVAVDQIRRIEASRDYALLHTATSSHILRITMSELERKLDPIQLLRVHRSAFIRPETVAKVVRGVAGAMHLQTEDGALIDIGPSYLRKVVTALGLSATDA